ncbi:basic salivary proline-rich protein 1-like [Lepus europaeus]|uniref:basic salivary proline-rich protein 1-like n=1 Tax=Lepus europaeus TaxID=9983 RepID=UPI002B498FC5|nr:basic salivary proline-rich protein 1-like [Lepus europaeus]
MAEEKPSREPPSSPAAKMEGEGGDTLPRGQDATHTGQQHVRMERLPLPSRQQRTPRQDGQGRGPPHGPPHPAGHRQARGAAPPSRPRSAPKLQGEKPHRCPGFEGWPRPGCSFQAKGDARWPRRPRGATSGPPPPGPQLGEGREARSCRFPAEGQQQLRSSAAGEGGISPRRPPGPGPGPGPPRRPPPTSRRGREGAQGEDVSPRAAPASVPGDAPAPPPRPVAPARPPRRRALTSGCAGRDGPAEPPAAKCVSAPPGKVPTAPGASGRGPEQRRERRQQREQPTSGAAHPELLPDPLPLPPPPRPPRPPPPSRSPPPPATSLRHRPGVGGVTTGTRRGRFDVRGIPPLGQVVPRGSTQPASTSGRQFRSVWGRLASQ